MSDPTLDCYLVLVGENDRVISDPVKAMMVRRPSTFDSTRYGLDGTVQIRPWNPPCVVAYTAVFTADGKCIGQLPMSSSSAADTVHVS